MKTKVMKIHPVARAFPTIPAKEMKLLREDIQKNGVREALLVNKAKDTIIDGRNRWLIATELGIQDKVKMDVFEGTEDEITSVILSRNLFRRHLSEDQRIAIATKFLAPKLEKEAEKRQKSGKKGTFGKDENGNGAGSVAEKLATHVKASVHKTKQAIRSRKKRTLGDVISGKKSLKQAAGKTKPRKTKATPTFEDQIWDRFVKWIKYWPTDKHRTVKAYILKQLEEDRPITVK